jgi:putative sigma-54 modulation protein
MRVQVKARNFDLSPEIRMYAEAKLARLSKQLADATTVEVELVEETKRSQQTAEATVYAKGSTLRATESTSDMRASIDRVVESIERQVVTYREKRRLERRRRTAHHGT